MVPQKPALAGIGPWRKLIDRNCDNNVVMAEPSRDQQRRLLLRSEEKAAPQIWFSRCQRALDPGPSALCGQIQRSSVRSLTQSCNSPAQAGKAVTGDLDNLESQLCGQFVIAGMVEPFNVLRWLGCVCRLQRVRPASRATEQVVPACGRVRASIGVACLLSLSNPVSR